MRMLTAVLNDNEIQQYIYEHEDYAFSYLKENLAIEPIFNYIIENINSFISDDDLEYSYESIKSISRNYVLRILNEADVANAASGSVFDTFFTNLQRFGFSDDDSGVLKEIASKLDTTRSEDFVFYIVHGNYNKAASIFKDTPLNITNGNQLLDRLEENSIIDKLSRFFNRLGRNDLSESLTQIKDFAITYPAYSIPATILGIVGCIGIFVAGKKLTNKIRNR